MTPGTVTVEEMETLVGHCFPGGTYTIAPWENALLCDAMVSERLPDDLAHPAFLFHAPLAGVGMSYGEIFELCHAESVEAVRAGEYAWEILRSLRVGGTYRMSGAIEAVVRKAGRRAGLMDIVTFRIDVDDVADGVRVATVVNSWIFLRGTR